MEKFVVSVRLISSEDVVVEAEDGYEATRLGMEVARAKFPHLSCFLQGDAMQADPDARFSTYTCTFCEAQSAKESWGHGRTKCPACGRRAPTASE